MKLEAIRNGVISEIVLVNVSGENKPALMSMLTSTLADYQVRVLDIGQAVIHDELSLGMLIQLPMRNQTALLKSALLERTRKLGAVIRFTDVTSDEYADWVAAAGQTPLHRDDVGGWRCRGATCGSRCDRRTPWARHRWNPTVVRTLATG